MAKKNWWVNPENDPRKSKQATIPPIPKLPQPKTPPTQHHQQHKQTKKLLDKLAYKISYFLTTKQPHSIYRTLPDDKIPNWLKNYQRNLEHSPLYRLPPEIIFEIVKNADRLTRHVMRRTCKIFLASIGDGDIRGFTRQQQGITIGGLGPSPSPMRQLVPWECPRWDYYSSVLWNKLVWPVHRPPSDLTKLLALLAQDIDKNSCKACHSHKISGKAKKTLQHFTTQQIWCSGCEDYHPLIFFSATQRKLPTKERICIGREGSIRLCSHKALTWDDIQEEASWTAFLGEQFYLEKDSRTCTDKSHHSPKDSWLREPRSPRVRISRLFGSDERHSIHITWTSPVFDLDHRRPIKKQDIRELLASQPDSAYLLGNALCPHVALDDGQLLIPFEPNQCVCFDHSIQEGNKKEEEEEEEEEKEEEDIPFTSPCHNCHGSYSDKCCRCLAASSEHLRKIDPRGRGRGRFMRSERHDNYGPNNYHDYTDSLGGEENTFYADLLSASSHEMRCSRCPARYSWRRSGLYGRRVFLDFESVFEMPKSPTCLDWLDKLDPESWGISRDEELRHVVWCPDAVGGCSRRYRVGRFLQALLPYTDERKEAGV